MSRLALDHRQRDPFVQQLDSMSMPQLMRREAPPDSGLDRCPVKLEPSSGFRPAMATSRADDHAEQWADGQLRPLGEPRLERRPSPGVHANLAAAVVLAMPDQNRPAPRVQI